jgi:hypothetical protein
MKKINIDSMLVVDDTGMPQAPGLRQLLDKDIRTLYTRDKTPDKKKYIQDCILIYQVGDPKSEGRQNGLSDKELIQFANEKAGLPKNSIPDALVLKLMKRYDDENITEAGRVLDNIMKVIHNINVSMTQINNFINDKLAQGLDENNIGIILQLADNVKKQAGDMPALIKKLEEAKENLRNEAETELSRGGSMVLSSMDAEAY